MRGFEVWVFVYNLFDREDELVLRDSESDNSYRNACHCKERRESQDPVIKGINKLYNSLFLVIDIILSHLNKQQRSPQRWQTSSMGIFLAMQITYNVRGASKSEVHDLGTPIPPLSSQAREGGREREIQATATPINAE